MGYRGVVNPTVVVSVRVPKEIVPKVDEYAKTKKRTRSRLVQDVFLAWFRKMEERETSSLDVASRLL